jgi:hypothetical protein
VKVNVRVFPVEPATAVVGETVMVPEPLGGATIREPVPVEVEPTVPVQLVEL